MALRPFLLALLTFSVFASASAQTPSQSAPPSAPTVTVSTAASRVRFVAIGAVRQTRLEVFDASGATVFDSGFQPGNIRDWDARTSGLADGAYTCALTTRELSGRLSIKQASALLRAGETSLALGEADAAGEAGATHASPVVNGNDAGAATLSTHDGRDGAVTSTAGALTLRTGDVLRGEDRERVRVTSEGKVGIGTEEPEALLDVAGAVRARGGFKFSDGSTLSSRGGRLTLTSESGEEVPALGASAAAATANRLAKFIDGTGTLGDSALTESGGFLGVGTSSPSTPVDVVYSDNNFGFGVNIRNTSTEPFALVGYGINNASGSRVGQFVYTPPAYVEASLRDTILFSSAGATTKLGFVSSADGSGTPDIYIRAGGARPNSIYVKGSTGFVGVGTDSPAARLHVQSGDIYIGGAGQGVILKAPNGTTCSRLTIDNGGALHLTTVACP